MANKAQQYNPALPPQAPLRTCSCGGHRDRPSLFATVSHHVQALPRHNTNTSTGQKGSHRMSMAGARGRPSRMQLYLIRFAPSILPA